MDEGVDDLREIVRRDVRRETDGDPGGAVDEQVRKFGRQNLRHGQAFVVIGDEVDGILIDIRQHLPRQFCHADFGVPHGGRRIAVDRAEVSLPVDERIAHAEILGQPDQRVIGGLIAVGMELTDDVADDAGRFLVGLVVSRSRVIEGVENTPVDGFQAVLDVGDGPADDDAHGVVQVGPLHLVFEADHGYIGRRRDRFPAFFDFLFFVLVFGHVFFPMSLVLRYPGFAP